MEKSHRDFATELLWGYHLITESFYLDVGGISDCKESLSLLGFDYTTCHFASVTKNAITSV